VPYEMKIAMTEQVLPWISRLQVTGYRLQAIEHRTLMVSGIAESALAIYLEEWERGLDERGLHLAYLPKDGTIRLRIDRIPDSPDKLDSPDSPDNPDTAFEELRALVKEWLVVDEDKPLEMVIGERLKVKGWTIATAESCTGGKLAALLNKHSGSSAWYWGSVVAYDNSVKRNVLGVSQENLDTFGAVSEQVVRQMADGARRVCGTDIAIATSGVAGPTGGTADKPVGTVWIAWATPDGTTAECFHLGRLREQITDRACTKALIKLLKMLQ